MPQSDLDRLIDLTSEMRHAQRECGRTESDASRRAAKRAEQRCDAFLEELSRPSLFTSQQD